MISRAILFAIVFLFIGCFSPPPEELDRSVFIADADYPGLPAYSEWGYNTFGAYFNDDVFLYDSSHPFQAVVEKDTLTLNFYGYRKDTDPNMGVTITFAFPGFRPSKYSDLVTLHATTFDFTSSSALLRLSLNSPSKTETISNGNVQFKRAQYVIVDGQPDRVILSGYFDFQTTIDNNTYTIKNGRFDIGINEINFYNY